MTELDRYEVFLKRLIEMTHSSSITWQYLDEDIDLARKIGLTAVNSGKEYYAFDRDNSFFAEQLEQNTYIVIYREIDTFNLSIALKIIPSTFKGILTLDSDDYGAVLTQLLNLVKRQFPNPEDFIDEILKL